MSRLQHIYKAICFKRLHKRTNDLERLFRIYLISDCGFRIVDFGLWISDCGFRIVDFGFRNVPMCLQLLEWNVVFVGESRLTLASF
jgi:hypothetical protein